ncbi:MAG: outer membrane protein transport protein [Desulfobacterales bacterium]|nr:MAG: outer membrane protein transport protein [Desulfobacterales bacterium]
MKKTLLRVFFLWGLITIFLAAPSWAGGLYIQEFATPSLGSANAGAEAWADNASTSFFNSAGMTRLDGKELMLGAGLIYADIKFDPAPDTPVTGGDGGNAGDFAPLLNAFYVHSLSDDLKFGVDILSLSAAVLDYDDNWTGRYQNQNVSIFTITLHPSLAYRVNDWFSIGGGIGLVYGVLDMEVAIPRPGPLSDGKAKIDGDDLEYAFNLAAMFELSDRTRLGVTYWSEVDLNFAGDVEIQPAGLQAGVDTSLPLVQWVRTGIYHEINDRFALLGTVGWEDWSALENVNLTTSTGLTPALPRNWKDTWHFAGGVHYRLSDPWLLQFGVAYDTSPVDTEDRTADMPVDRQIRFNIGTQFEKNEKMTIGCAFEYADLGDAEINDSNPVTGLKGKYKNNELFAFVINFNRKF